MDKSIGWLKSINNLAELYYKQGKYNKSEELFKEYSENKKGV